MEGSQVLVETLKGDLAAFAELSRWEHSTLQEYAAQAGELVLGPAAVRRVLVALERGETSPSLIQEWASFMRRGYLSDGYAASNGSRAPRGPIRGIGINYDSAAEEKITSAIARLDEIGDLVDGEIGQDEIAAMIDELS